MIYQFAVIGLAAELSPAVRSVEDRRVSSDRVPLFEPLPDLESQEWPWLSPPKPGASYKSRVASELDGYGDQRKQKN